MVTNGKYLTSLSLRMVDGLPALRGTTVCVFGMVERDHLLPPSEGTLALFID
jgi:hypothetical protein